MAQDIVLTSTALETEKQKVEFFDSPASEVVTVLSDLLKIDIVLAENLTAKKVSYTFVLSDCESTLKSLSWILGVDYEFRDGKYYFGGVKEIFEIIDSGGLDTDIGSIYGDKVKVVGDKIIIKGSESDIKRLSESLKKTVRKDVLRVWLNVSIVTYSYSKELGIDFRPNIVVTPISYDAWKGKKVSFERIFENSSIDIKVKNDFAVDDVNVLIDTELHCISGRKNEIMVGTQQDREIYNNVPAGGQDSQFVSDYKSYNYGLNISLEPYCLDGDWYVKAYIEDSRKEDKLTKAIKSVKGMFSLQDNSTVILCNLVIDSSRKSKTGILGAFSFFDWLVPENVVVQKTELYITLAANIDRSKAGAGDILK